MLKPIYLNRFKKETLMAKKRGKDIVILRNIINLLIEEKPLPAKHRNHKLQGEYKGLWESHIEPDWLLIYEKTDTEIILVRTGSHSELFK